MFVISAQLNLPSMCFYYLVSTFKIQIFFTFPNRESFFFWVFFFALLADT